jgi:hypothetical protein
MSKYVHEDSTTEFTTGMIVFVVVGLLVLGVIVGGVFAAVPALFGAADAALWVWGMVLGLWTGNVGFGLVNYLRESRKIS